MQMDVFGKTYHGTAPAQWKTDDPIPGRDIYRFVGSSGMPETKLRGSFYSYPLRQTIGAISTK